MKQLNFTAAEVARLAGFKTVLMLNYLERSGTFTRQYDGPAHHGKRRVYTFRDIIILRAINRLLQLGARPKRIVEAMATFSEVAGLPQDIDALAEFARKSSLFVVTSDNVIYCEPEDLVDLSAKGQLAFSFMVDNSAALTPVADAIVRYFDALDQSQPRNRAILDKIATEVGL